MKLFKILMVMGVLAFGATANAATITPTSIDFGTGVGTGGTIVWDEITNEVVGTDIAINAVNVADAEANNGGYTAVALLNFDTETGAITVTGTMGVDAGTGLTVSQDLFTGTISDWTYDAGTISVFTGDGAGTISADFATFIGEPLPQVYDFVEFSLNIGEDTRSTDLLLSAGSKGITPPEVPVPAAVWLFGSGLLGLVGIARRKPMA